MKNKKAFTLVELLAVIVILAVILVIAVPQIMNVITESRKGALISSAKLIAGTAETKKLSNDTLGINKTIKCEDVSKLNSEDYDSCTITFDSNGKAKVTIVGKGKFEGMAVCEATKEDAEISGECATDVACFAYDEIQQVSSFDINEEACKTYVTNQDWGYTDEEKATYCTGGEVDGYTMKDDIDEGYFTIEELETARVISNVQYSESVISITDYNETCLKDVIIPSKIGDKSVVYIGEKAFYDNQLTSVTIPNSVTSIGKRAFYANELTSVTIPNSVTIIGYKAFSNNQLTSVTIPNSVTSLGNRAFQDNQLTSVTIPNGVTSIGDYSFSGNQLSSVTIPNGVTSIGDYSFSGNQLSSVTIPNSVTYIGEEAFCGNQLTSVTIPNSVTTIGNYAFDDNQLTSITIPNSVTYIGQAAFNNNKLSDNDAYIYKRNSDGSIDNTYVVSYGGAKKDITIPNGVTIIGNDAFSINQLTSVNIPNSVTTIGKSAFYGNALTNVTIPNSVTEIGREAFYKSSNSNPNLISIINTTGRSFDWSDIITGSSGTSAVTDTYNGVNVTTE